MGRVGVLMFIGRSSEASPAFDECRTMQPEAGSRRRARSSLGAAFEVGRGRG